MFIGMNAYDISLLRRPAAEVRPAQLAARVMGFKVNFLNKLIRLNEVADLIQFGRADGRLLRRLKIGCYTGVDEAAAVPPLPAGPGRRFLAARDLPVGAAADLALSMDVVDRLTDDGEFNGYIRELFAAARRFVVIHGSESGPAWAVPGISGRRFTSHVARYFPAWRLAAHVPNPVAPSAAGDFFIYAREAAGCVIPVIPPV